MRNSLLALSLTLLSLPVFAADVSVTTPAVNAQVTSPFNLNAASQACGGAATTSMVYSIDNATATTVPGTGIMGAAVTASLGTHILHVNCSASGAAGVPVDIPITVYETRYNLELLSTWVCQNDPQTPGASSGATTLEASNVRRFDVTYSSYAGELCHVTWANDPTVHAFIYAADVMLDTPATVANVELDMNQVTANGQTVIYGVQCDGWSGTWDYTRNSGTAASPNDAWIHSAIPCQKPSTWGAGVWHHVQLGYRRDDVGNVTYVFVQWDYGAVQSIGQTVFSSFALNWTGGTLLTNYQLDGLLPGSNVIATAHLRNLSIKRY